MDHADIVGDLTKFFEEEEIIEDIVILSNGTDLIDSGVIDSLVLVMLVGYCEEQFACVLEPDELIEDNFRSLDKIATYISMKMEP